jgi:endogenous inhibitor of DNA gyrase (YacG/DUF329 family)
MTEFGDGAAVDKVVRETVTERVVETTCPACGEKVVPTRGPGRPSRYCSAACRQEAWALRAAERKLGTKADRRPTVIRDVIDRHTERVIERAKPVTTYGVSTYGTSPTFDAADAPTNGRGWMMLLAVLEQQLADPASKVSTEYFHHKRLAAALDSAYRTLGNATPGGPEHLR